MKCDMKNWYFPAAVGALLLLSLTEGNYRITLPYGYWMNVSTEYGSTYLGLVLWTIARICINILDEEGEHNISEMLRWASWIAPINWMVTVIVAVLW